MSDEKEIEQWEIDLRARLDEELSDGAYDISSPGLSLSTGKGGYIEYQVQLEKMYRKYSSTGIKNQLTKVEEHSLPSDPLTAKKLEEYITEIFKLKK